MALPFTDRPAVMRALVVLCIIGMGAVQAHGAVEALRSNGDGTYAVADIPGGLQASIDAHGFTLIGREGAPQCAFSIIGVGRHNGPLQPNTSGEAQRTENELYFPGDRMGVHYRTSSEGLRQNFFVFGPPSGTGALEVGLYLEGAAVPSLLGEDGLRFHGAESTVFDYRGLHCWDATGKGLEAHFELERYERGHRLHIVVNDPEAQYPITIDPVSTSPNTLLVGTGAGWEFGIAVSTAGDLNGDGRSDVVVGAWQAAIGQSLEGIACVYYGTNTGISTTPSVVLQSDQNGAQMGNAVSTAGDVNGDGYSDLLVGARTWESDVVNELSEGAVFVYYGSASGIGTSPNIILQPDHAADNFGSNLACAGDINNDGYSDVLVGAYLSSYPTFNEGAVFVYMGGPGGLSNTPQHRLERNQGGAFFGRSVSGAGDVNGDGYSDVIIGSSKFIYTAGATDQGSAFVYYGSAAGLGAGLNPAPALQLFGTGNNTAYYGWWVTCAGDLNGDGYSDVAVSAYNDNIGGEVSEGLVFVYHGSAAGVNPVAAVTLQSNQANAWMGRCLSTAGDMNGDGYADLLVGTSKYSNPESLEGISTLYFGSSTGISTAASATFQLDNAGANFGESVSTAGDVNGDGWSDVIIGARIYGSGGAAAVFHGGPYSTNLAPTLSRFGGMTNALLGASTANAGDVNGDGYSDVLVGAPGASIGESGEGVVYVHAGASTGLPIPPTLTLQMNVASAQFGASASSAGDVNGDGYADVLVGAPGNGTGKAYLFMGGSSGLSTVPVLTLTGGSQYGASVSTAGDINADGYADILIGAPGSGQVSVHYGGAIGPHIDPDLVITQVQAGGLFGCSVSTAGDVNGDGYSDVIIGARGWSNGQAGEGAAFIFHGASTGLVVPYARMLEPNQIGAAFGTSVAGAGDVNGDGYFDVVVGADLWESGQTDEGGAFIYHGSASGIPATANATLQRNITNGRMGSSVSEAGDVNGDGYADVAVGAYLSENNAGTADEGLTYVYMGSTTGMTATGYDLLEVNLTNYQLGRSVCGGGDVDGDGYSDVVVGATGAAPALSNEGGMYWFRGGKARGIIRYTRQYDADLVTPMSTNSDDFSNFSFFGIGHRSRSAIHRCRTRLRWEIANEGLPWSGLPITNSVGQTGVQAAWTTLPLNGAEIKQLVPKAGAWIRYKWRVREEYDLAKLIDGQRFSRWFYGYASAVGDIGVLPIELLTFTGEANGAVNGLHWSTATEQNSDRFDIQRSLDGAEFTTIGSVNAAGQSLSELHYDFTDRWPPPQGLAYYRLRSVDHDGAEELSGMIAIARVGSIATIHPNPADDQVGVVVNDPQEGDELKLIDTQGRVVRTEALNGKSGQYGVVIDVSDLAAGAYTVTLRDRAGSVQASARLIVR